MAGDLKFRVDWDITPAEAKQNKLQREFEQNEAKLKQITEEHKKTLELIEAEKKKQADITKEIAKQDALVEDLNRKKAAIESGKVTPAQIREWGSAEQIQQQIDAQLAATDKLEATRQKSLDTQSKLENSAARETLEMQKQENKTRTSAENIALQAQNEEQVATSTKHATNAFEKFTKRIVGLAKRVFIFSLITKALRALRKAIAEKISADSGLAKYLAEIKGNLAVIGQTLFEAAKPIIEWILQKVALLTQLLSIILARVLKKDVKQMAQFAKQSAKAQKSAEKTTASWDTLQQIKSNEDDNSAGISANYEQFDMAKWTEEQLTKIEAIAAGAMLALGLILCFAGNIPLGIALIAAGAALLWKEVIPNWNLLGEDTKRSIYGIWGMLAGAALVVIGIVLLFSGAGTAIGLGLIIAGIAAFGISAIYMNWDTVKGYIADFFAKAVGFLAGAALIALGLLLCGTVVGIPFGLALILAGVKQTQSGLSWNWNSLVEKVTKLKDNILYIVDQLFNGIKTKNKDMVKNAVNKVIEGLNWVVNAANKLLDKIFNSGWATALFGALNIDTSNWRIPPISYLAQGAVIPGGKPFMAVMGDQPSGKTNLEAPEDLIRQIVREESGNININFTGSLAQLARVLNPEITREQNRSTMWTGARV